jgi:hypothetical protein
MDWFLGLLYPILAVGTGIAVWLLRREENR